MKDILVKHKVHPLQSIPTKSMLILQEQTYTVNQAKPNIIAYKKSY